MSGHTAAPPFAVSISPASVRLEGTAITAGYHGHVTVRDSGSQPVHITVSGESLSTSAGSCNTPSGQPHWLTVSGVRQFTLAPGQSRTVSYAVHGATVADTGQSGAVVALATPVHAGDGSAKLSGSVGSRVSLGTPGTTSCHVAAPVHHTGGFHAAAVIIPVIVFAVLVVAGLVVIRKLRSRTS